MPFPIQLRKPSDASVNCYKNTAPRGSIGSLFGKTLSPLTEALSKSCSVLTAVVTSLTEVVDYPDVVTSDEDDDGQSDVDTVRDTGPVRIEISSCDDRDMSASGHNNVRLLLSEKPYLCNSLESLDNATDQLHDTDDSSDSTRKDRICVDYCVNPGEGVDTADEHKKDVADCGGSVVELRPSNVVKKRPPPPSYPPPPVPPNVVFHV